MQFDTTAIILPLQYETDPGFIWVAMLLEIQILVLPWQPILLPWLLELTVLLGRVT